MDGKFKQWLRADYVQPTGDTGRRRLCRLVSRRRSCETSRLSQSLKLPAATPKLYLIYKYWAFSNESRCTYDLAYVYLEYNRIQSVKLCSSSNTNG